MSVIRNVTSLQVLDILHCTHIQPRKGHEKTFWKLRHFNSSQPQFGSSKAKTMRKQKVLTHFLDHDICSTTRKHTCTLHIPESISVQCWFPLHSCLQFWTITPDLWNDLWFLQSVLKRGPLLVIYIQCGTLIMHPGKTMSNWIMSIIKPFSLHTDPDSVIIA